MGKSAPKPPDPKDTSAAQTGTSVSTAIANAFLGNVNQVTPDGTLSYDQTGNYQWTDPYTNKSYTIPTFTATQTLSPEQQQLHDTNVDTQQNLANVGKSQSAFLNDYLGQPVDLSAANIDKYTNDHFLDQFNKQWGQNQSDLESKLANQGIQMGSDAYTRALGDFGTQKQSALNSYLGSMYGQAQQSILAQRNQPLNELSAILSGSQVSQPNFVNPNEPTIPTTDNAGIIQQNYQDRLAAWQQQNAMTQNILGGLFGLGAAGVYKYSDRRLKEDIKKVGETDDGLGVYSYRYKSGGPMQLGLMAQEVEKKTPEAVKTMPSGYKAVNYDKALHLGAM